MRTLKGCRQKQGTRFIRATKKLPIFPGHPVCRMQGFVQMPGPGRPAIVGNSTAPEVARTIGRTSEIFSVFVIRGIEICRSEMLISIPGRCRVLVHHSPYKRGLVSGSAQFPWQCGGLNGVSAFHANQSVGGWMQAGQQGPPCGNARWAG